MSYAADPLSLSPRFDTTLAYTECFPKDDSLSAEQN